MIINNLNLNENTDEENIALLHDEQCSEDMHNQVVAFLLEKYKPLVKTQAYSMKVIGGEPDDLLQEGMIGLYKAIQDYDSGRDASFFTFARLCVQRQIYTAVTASNRKKHTPLNEFVSFETKNDEEGIDIEDTLSMNEGNSNPELLIIQQENIDSLEKAIDENLSKFEKSVLELHLTGMNYTDIAKVLNRDDKSVDNALQRIKSKLKDFK